MSGAFPASPVASSVKITSTAPTLISVSHSLKRQTRSRGGQRWMMEVNYPPLTRAQFAPLWAFSAKQRGRYESFTFIPPVYGNSRGTATGTLLVNNASGYSAGDTTIAADGLTGTLLAGDFIKFSGHDKVYTITADGSTTLTIEPPLLSSVADNEAITYNSVPFTVSFGADTQEMAVGIEGVVEFSIALVEVA